MAARTREELKANINRDIVIGDENSITVAEVNAILIDAADSMALVAHTHPTQSVQWGDVQGKPAFAPANAEQNVQADWNASGGDAFIRNKPSLPPANAERNVQANWSQTNTASDSYILNKPDLTNALRIPSTADVASGLSLVRADGGTISWDHPPPFLPYGAKLDTTGVAGDGSAGTNTTGGMREVELAVPNMSVDGIQTQNGNDFEFTFASAWQFDINLNISNAAGTGIHRDHHELQYSIDGGIMWMQCTNGGMGYTRVSSADTSQLISGSHFYIAKADTTIRFRVKTTATGQDVMRVAYSTGQLSFLRLG